MLGQLGFGLTAGRNRLQGPLVPGQQRAWTRPVPVEAVKAAGAVTGSTVNDLMLTRSPRRCAHTMLQWMGQLPATVQNAWVDAFAGQATAIVTNVSGPRHHWAGIGGDLIPVGQTEFAKDPAFGELR